TNDAARKLRPPTRFIFDRTLKLARRSNGCSFAAIERFTQKDPQRTRSSAPAERRSMKDGPWEGTIMATNLIALVTQFLTPDLIARIASALGLDRTLAQKAISAALPSLSSGLAGTASSPDGARQLSNVLAQQPPDPLDSLKNAIGGTAQRALVDSGSNLWSTLLGGGTMNALSSAIGKFAGIGDGASKSLLGLLAPAVMGALGQQQRSAGLDAGGLATLLASQKDQFAAAIPSALADRLSGAGLLDTVEEGVRSSAAAAASAANRFGDASERTVARASQAASAARSNAMSQLPLWLIALAVLAGVTWYFLGSHGGGDVAEQTRPTTTQQVDQPRNVATERGELPRATTGAATQNLSVGGVDLAKQVGASVGSVKAALAGITDVNSAQAALPKIQE